MSTNENTGLFKKLTDQSYKARVDYYGKKAFIEDIILVLVISIVGVVAILKM